MNLDSGWFWGMAAYRILFFVYVTIGFSGDADMFLFAGVASFFDLVVCRTFYQKSKRKDAQDKKNRTEI